MSCELSTPTEIDRLHAFERESGDSDSLRQECIARLVKNQNPDGGWGYQPSLQSATEPTSWALIALRKASDPGDPAPPAIRQGLEWLKSTQLDSGAWPARPGQGAACWTTALAARALHLVSASPASTRRGVQWLCDAWPAEGGFWWRLRHQWRGHTRLTNQNSSLRGWSWVPRTASWVEPTAYCLMLLNAVPESERPARARERQKLGEAMLYDRICPGGGWNNGNPMVYGVAGEPRVGPTALALLALQAHSDRAENRQSLEWLERVYPSITGPGSTALAYLALDSYGRSLPPLEGRVRAQHAGNSFLRNTLVVAWVLSALNQ
jgi:hypothetical protein